jgi:hypothetical protein
MFTLNAFGQRVYCQPRLRFVKDDGGDKGGGDKQQKQEETKDDKSKDDKSKDSERGWPANTPVKDMTLEQQNAYHAFHARKHEERVKAYGDVTPEQLAEIIKERDELKTKTQTDDEKAIEAAKAEGAAPFKAALAEERVKNALERALVGRTVEPSKLLELDRSKFVKDDKADTDAIAAWVEENTSEAAAGGGAGGKKAVDLGQGKRGTATPEKGVSAGRDLFASTRKTPTKSNDS